MSRFERKEKIGRTHMLPISRQCEALDISRSSAYRLPAGVSEDGLNLMRKLDELHLRHPFKGSRRLRDDLWDAHGLHVNRKRVQRLMRLMGIRALSPGARTTRPNTQHKVYPYLLRDLAIHRANQAWCTDITYIPMRKGFLYLVAIMDWYSRKVLAWRLSNSLDTVSCIEALGKHWRPMAHRRSLTAIRAVNLPVTGLPMCSKPMRSVSAWMARAAGWTMCLSSASGAA